MIGMQQLNIQQKIIEKDSFKLAYNLITLADNLKVNLKIWLHALDMQLNWKTHKDEKQCVRRKPKCQVKRNILFYFPSNKVSKVSHICIKNTGNEKLQYHLEFLQSKGRERFSFYICM